MKICSDTLGLMCEASVGTSLSGRRKRWLLVGLVLIFAKTICHDESFGRHRTHFLIQKSIIPLPIIERKDKKLPVALDQIICFFLIHPKRS